MIRMLLGLTRASAGSMRLLGRPVPARGSIVYGGRVVTQGPIGELARGGNGGGGGDELLIAVADPALALLTLDGHRLVRTVRLCDEGLRVVLAGGPETAMEVNARLVEAGVGVMRLEPVRQTLEQRFLQITSRLDSTPAGVTA